MYRHTNTPRSDSVSVQCHELHWTDTVEQNKLLNGEIMDELNMTLITYITHTDLLHILHLTVMR